jgi:hypothetical protein
MSRVQGAICTLGTPLCVNPLASFLLQPCTPRHLENPHHLNRHHCCLQLFVAFFLPETKGLLIEDVHEVFASHWFWKRTGVVTHSKVTRSTAATLTSSSPSGHLPHAAVLLLALNVQLLIAVSCPQDIEGRPSMVGGVDVLKQASMLSGVSPKVSATNV